jgi:hypothetical protein
MQEPDWSSVFAPTLMYTSLRVILALAVYHDYEIEQIDVVTAFLNANVVSNIYMEQPHGFEEKSKDGGTLVCKLKKALYGIREAPPSLELPPQRLVDQRWLQTVQGGPRRLHHHKKVKDLHLHILR